MIVLCAKRWGSCALVLITCCSLPTFAQDSSGFAEHFAAVVGTAHGIAAWRAQSAVAAQITVRFGGQLMVQGTLLCETQGGRVRMELADGTVLLFDGHDVWTHPANSPFQGARFHVLTWPYFLAVPMKLRDPGAALANLGVQPLDATRQLPAARLTFAPGTGDSPDDWYVIYLDPTTRRVAAMAYIVTFGRDLAAAEKEPHAIAYEDWTEVNGVWFARKWGFFNWDPARGLVGEPLGQATLDDLRFVTPDPQAFVKPEGARLEPLPQPANP